jgi:hypothetical protein
MPYRATGVVTTAFMVVSLLGSSAATGLTLVEDGIPRAVIVMDEAPAPAARLAAMELQHHVEQITGAVLEITNANTDAQGVRILIGESAATRRLGLKAEDFSPQEYLIRITEDTVVLIGRDWEDTEANRNEVGRDTQMRSLSSWRKRINYDEAVGRQPRGQEAVELPGILDDQGTCYAVYDFLERFCGVRWYGPTPLNVVVPSTKTLTVSSTEIRRSPSLKHRYGEGGNWPMVRAQWNKPSDAQTQLFYRRLRMGGSKWAGNHSFSSFRDRFLVRNEKSPELWETSRPDFFAVGWDHEGNWRHLCLTNPDVIAQVVKDARDYFDGRGLKGSQPACGDYFAIVPQDSENWCKCDKCQAILERGKERTIRGAFASGHSSDYVFGFVNAVAREVRKTHPDKYILALAYHGYSSLPTFPLEPNITVAPCVQTCYGYTGVINNEEKIYSQWVAEKSRPRYVWNYFHHPMERAIMQGWKCFPVFMPDVISTWVKRYYHDGIRGFYLCGIGEQADYYLYMQLAFNAEMDENQLLDEFFSRYFGAAGDPMKRFYYRISEINREERRLGTSPESSWGRLGTEERMQELGTLMNRAVELAETDLELRRVETWKTGVWDYMAKGRSEYVRKQRAYEKKEFPIPVYSTGVDDDNQLLADGAVDPHWRLTQSGDDRWKGPQTYALESDTPPTPAGAKPSTASKWAVPGADLRGVANGQYLYEQTFHLDGLALDTASIVGRIVADDVVRKIEFNGVDIGQAGADFSAWRDIIITEHFVEGLNTLRIVVVNNGPGMNPSGLRVELSGSADGKK